MVVRYEVAGMDLAEVRFAISPVNELVLSLRAWRDPGRYPEHLPWLHQVDGLRTQLDTDLLLALVNGRLWTPDFLIPRPRSPLTRIEEQLELLRRTDLDVVAREIHALHDGSPPPVLDGPVPLLRDRITEALRDYWELCFAPHWTRIRTLLEADVQHRAREMAAHGIGHMLSGLESNVVFAENVVTIHLISKLTYTRSTSGTGLTLVPALFTRHASTPTSGDEAPMIHYGVRGLGTLWQVEHRPVPPDAVAGLLGRTRASLLVRLADPASSTELAGRMGVSVPAVNQHLRALQAGGLLTSARYGRAVLYRRSALGDALLGDQPPPSATDPGLEHWDRTTHGTGEET